jgi:hypothetical protein
LAQVRGALLRLDAPPDGLEASFSWGESFSCEELLLQLPATKETPRIVERFDRFVKTIDNVAGGLPGVISEQNGT